MSVTTQELYNIELWEAMEMEDVNKVGELLDRGADPNHNLQYISVTGEAIRHSYIEIVKLLVKYGADAEIENEWMGGIFNSKNSKYSKELVEHIIEYNKSNVEVLHEVFRYLIESGLDGPPALEILKILLDNGLPVKGFPSCRLLLVNDSYTPLHVAVFYCRMDFIEVLLKHGADIFQKTGLGMNNINVASWCGDEEVIKMLVKRGIDINEKSLNGKTALHAVCCTPHPYSVYTLLKYGADPNIMDNDGKTPIMYSEYLCIQIAMVEEFAKLKFENRPICSQNSKLLQADEILRTIFDNCLDLLQKMKNIKIYNGYTLYDIKMKKYRRKLALLAQNKDFVVACKLSKNHVFKFYQNDLFDNILGDILKRKDILLEDEKKMLSIFKEFLPELVISKVVYYLNEHLFI